MVSPGENAQMICTVDANPITDDTIKWVRDGYDMEGRTKTTRDGNTMYLTVINSTETDAGEFECVVNNGIGAEVKNKSFLLVKRKFSSLLCVHIFYIEILWPFRCPSN